MNTNMANIDEEQALARLLAPDSSPVATPAMLMSMAQWLHATLKREIAERPVNDGQQWGRISDIMRIYGVSKSQAHNWMVRLRAEGRVSVQNPISGIKGKGDTFFCLADVQKAFEENANRISKK